MAFTNRIIDYKITESSVTEPVTLTEVKNHLLIDSTSDDTMLTAMITQARKAVENYCSISLVNKTVILSADIYQEQELPWGPVKGITNVEIRNGASGSGPVSYATADGGWQTDGSEFLTFIPQDLTVGGLFGVNNPNNWNWWPRRRYTPENNNRYRITYNVGYISVPEDLKLAILNEIAYRYENRGDSQNIRATAFSDQGACEPARVLAMPYVRRLWL